VARIYAGILALVAFLTALTDGLLRAADPDTILARAWCSLWVFAAVGYMLGWTAERIVDDSLRSRLAAEIAAEQAADGPAAKPSPNAR
jgi:hypothetical protein